MLDLIKLLLRNLPSFRPLSGSYISQCGTKMYEGRMTILFPSPIGELHFSMVRFRAFRFNPLRVSVPYRGATFLNGRIQNDKRSDFGFRPLSGSYISQSEGHICNSLHQIVSVPYRGATFLNNIPFSVAIQLPRFRPLSGSYISQLSPVAVPSADVTVSFRPLSGSYISQ